MNPIMDAIKQHLGGGAPPSPDMGGGAPGPDGSGLPPALMSAIQAGAPQGGPEDSPEHEGDEVSLLRKIIYDIHTFLKVAADEDDKSVMTKCLAQMQAIRAKDQAESDKAMAGSASPRLARKTAAAVGGPGGGSGY